MIVDQTWPFGEDPSVESEFQAVRMLGLPAEECWPMTCMAQSMNVGTGPSSGVGFDGSCQFAF